MTPGASRHGKNASPVPADGFYRQRLQSSVFLRKCPIKRAGAGSHWPGLHFPLFKPGHRADFGMLPVDKICLLHEGRPGSRWSPRRSSILSSSEMIRWRVMPFRVPFEPRFHGSIFRHEQIGSGELGHIPDWIQHDCIVETCLIGFT